MAMHERTWKSIKSSLVQIMNYTLYQNNLFWTRGSYLLEI